MSVLGELRPYASLATGMRDFARHTLTLEQAQTIVRQRLADREASFLRLLEKGVFGYPKSPYLALLRLAQIELGDVRSLVQDKGLEGALMDLRQAGVYVAYEEFRGTQPIVRQGQALPVDTAGFDNPFHAHHYTATTGGTGGPARRITHDLNHILATAPHDLLVCHVHGVLNAPTAIWRGILPDGSGINSVLRSAPRGGIPQRWFSHIVPRGRHDLKNVFASCAIVALGRINRMRLPWPEWVPLEKADVVARWARDALREAGTCVIHTQASRALRVSVAAQEAGIDLTGAWFRIAGEPCTPAKVAGMRRSGAKVFTSYGMSESGRVGMGCGSPQSEDDVHVLKDVVAIIQRPRSVAGTDVQVLALHFTTLLETCPKIMLNVETDDYGVVERRNCGCPFEELGLDEHLSEIRSFGKLKGEGVTLVGSSMVRILEQVLPERFGGSSLDYQLLEEEDDQGFTRLSLVVHPRVEIPDEQAVIRAILESLQQDNAAADVAQDVWGRAGTLRIKRIEPIWTARGKLMPLHIERARKEPSPGQH